MRDRRPLTILVAALVALALISSSSGDQPADAGLHATPEYAEASSWLRAHGHSLTEPEVVAAATAVVLGARQTGLEVGLVLAVIEVESAGDAFAYSSAGAIGLMQLRPFTAEATARRLGLPWAGPADLTDPAFNVRLGTAYLRKLIDRFGSVEEALAAYNWGPGRIADRLARGAPIPSRYTRRVEAAFGGPLERGAQIL